MKICQICLKSDFLCAGCRKKLESSRISELDVALSRALFKLGIDGDFIKTFDAMDYAVVVTDKRNAGILIGRAGKNARRISLMLGKDVRIIEQVDDEKKFIEKAINAPVLGINKIYGKSETYKIKVERRFRPKVENLSQLLSRILDKNVKLVFE